MNLDFQVVTIEKLVHGGQGLATLKDGKKVFVWNTLPREKVAIELYKSKKNFAEAMAIEIIKPSNYRVSPRDENFLATSPWQIMDFDFENSQKAEIVHDVFGHEKIGLPDFEVVSDGLEYHYRNKMEYSFYGDDGGVHLALYNRGTHQKQIVDGCSLAMPAIDVAAKDLLAELNKIGMRAGDMKSVIIRCNQAGDVVAGLFVKPMTAKKIELPPSIKSLVVYHSNPKSPASLPTKKIVSYGEPTLSDELLGVSLAYDIIGFFQVNLPVFELALKKINTVTSGGVNKIDMYSGVGSIGIPIGGTKTLVELDEANVDMARKNSKGLGIDVVHASVESALSYITANSTLIVDPPRSGLHKDVISRILAEKPSQICYLSCNPSTQARDISMLVSGGYEIDDFSCYNFFPHTPHIETLAVLKNR